MVFAAGLLLFAAQLVSIVHATDHPFHADDELCAAFACFEKNDHATASLLHGSEISHFTDEPPAGLARLAIYKTSAYHQPRAPPLQT